MALNEIQEAAFFRESTTYDSLNTKAGPYFLHTSRHHNVNAYFWYCLSYFLNLNVFKSADWFPVGRLIKTENIVAAKKSKYLNKTSGCIINSTYFGLTVTPNFKLLFSNI